MDIHLSLMAVGVGEMGPSFLTGFEVFVEKFDDLFLVPLHDVLSFLIGEMKCAGTPPGEPSPSSNVSKMVILGIPDHSMRVPMKRRNEGMVRIVVFHDGTPLYEWVEHCPVGITGENDGVVVFGLHEALILYFLYRILCGHHLRVIRFYWDVSEDVAVLWCDYPRMGSVWDARPEVMTGEFLYNPHTKRAWKFIFGRAFYPEGVEVRDYFRTVVFRPQ